MIFNKKSFLKVALGITLSSTFLPLTIACTQAAPVANDLQKLQAEISQIPSNFQLKMPQSFSASDFQDWFNNQDEKTSFELLKEKITVAKEANKPLKKEFFNFKLQGLKVKVLSLEVQNNEILASLVFTYKKEKIQQQIRIKNFLVKNPLDVKLLKTYAQKINALSSLEKALQISSQKETLVPLAKDLTSLNSLDHFLQNNLFSATLDLSEGVTLDFIVGELDKDGILSITVIFKKGNLQEQSKVFFKGFTSQKQKTLDLLAAKINALEPLNIKDEVAKNKKPEVTSWEELKAFLKNDLFQLPQGVKVFFENITDIDQKNEVRVQIVLKEGTAQATATIILQGFKELNVQEVLLKEYFAQLPQGSFKVKKNTFQLPRTLSIEALSDLLEGQISAPVNASQNFTLKVSYSQIVNKTVTATIEGETISSEQTPNEENETLKLRHTITLNGFVKESDFLLVQDYLSKLTHDDEGKKIQQFLVNEKTFSLPQASTYQSLINILKSKNSQGEAIIAPPPAEASFQVTYGTIQNGDVDAWVSVTLNGVELAEKIVLANFVDLADQQLIEAIMQNINKDVFHVIADQDAVPTVDTLVALNAILTKGDQIEVLQLDVMVSITYYPLWTNQDGTKQAKANLFISKNNAITSKEIVLQGFVSPARKEINRLKRLFLNGEVTTNEPKMATEAAPYASFKDFFARVKLDDISDQFQPSDVTILPNAEYQFAEGNTRKLRLQFKYGGLEENFIITVKGFLNPQEKFLRDFSLTLKNGPYNVKSGTSTVSLLNLEPIDDEPGEFKTVDDLNEFLVTEDRIVIPREHNIQSKITETDFGVGLVYITLELKLGEDTYLIRISLNGSSLEFL